VACYSFTFRCSPPQDFYFISSPSIPAVFHFPRPTRRQRRHDGTVSICFRGSHLLQPRSCPTRFHYYDPHVIQHAFRYFIYINFHDFPLISLQVVDAHVTLIYDVYFTLIFMHHYVTHLNPLFYVFSVAIFLSPLLSADTYWLFLC